MSRLLILGRSGQVARELTSLAGDAGYSVQNLGRDDVDLSGTDAEPLLKASGADLVINAAAYTAVDRAEAEAGAAFALNAKMPAAWARACASASVPFVHISTDYVFDGSAQQPYRESDPPRPLGVYGRSKAEGEAGVLSAGGATAIVRTAWVYSAFGSNFVKTMLRLAGDRDEIAVVGDQFGCPTWARDVAQSCLLLGESLHKEEPHAAGVFHAAGLGEASWADFAEAIFEESATRHGPSARVRRIGTRDYPTPAARPMNSRLDCARLEAAVGWRPPAWRASLAKCFDNMPA